MNNAFFLLLLFPLIWPFIAKRIWNQEITWTEMGINIFGIVVLVSGVYFAGTWSATADTEVWNGYITGKKMTDGHYVRTYECNCTESCSGSGSSRSCTRTCQTCYEDHYTRSYDGFSTVGNFTFDSIDTTSRSRRDAFPAPAAYKRCQKGQPASREHGYTNYVQAVPQSLFHDDSQVAELYADRIPQYPRVYGFYQYRRVINMGTSVPVDEQNALNQILNEELKSLGASKQVNIIVILTRIMDPNFRYAVENAWLGGEKNDVIVFIGTEDGKTAGWVDVMTWALNSGNELFHVKLRDELKNTPLLAEPLAGAITSKIAAHYDRPQMADYEYLKNEVEPAPWVMGVAIFLSIVGSIILSIIMQHVDIDFSRRSGYRRVSFGRRSRFRL